MTQPEYPYTTAAFDFGYYQRGERGGFRNYSYDHPEQQDQLRMKLAYCNWHGPVSSVLFVGCGYGFEVKYFIEHGIKAWGIDVSEHAIANVPEAAKPFCHVFDGSHIGSLDDDVDIVAAFDVLTLVPQEMIFTLCSEMVRVARRRIIVRTIIKNYRNWTEEWDGVDGVSYRYLPFHDWDRMFSSSGKFRFHAAQLSERYEGVFVWQRVQA